MESRNSRQSLCCDKRVFRFRFLTAEDKEQLEKWLKTEGIKTAYSEDELAELSFTRLYDLKIELPAENEVRRIINSALASYFESLQDYIARNLSEKTIDLLDELTTVTAPRIYSDFDLLKDDPNRSGVKSLNEEINKPPAWAELVFDTDSGKTKIQRHYYELCVLSKTPETNKHAAH